MNILILGTGEIEQELINICLKSKLLDRLYTASSKPLKNIPNIEYTGYEDLCHKAKVIQADLVLLANKNMIQDGVVEILRKNLLNVISVNKKWYNLESSRLIAKQLINHYSINLPDTIKAPLSFPIVIKTDKPNTTKIASSMQELVKIREELASETVFLEEHLMGNVHYLTSLWDGKSLYHLPLPTELTEVQQDRLDLYKTKLNFMLSDEKADFIGFFTTKLIWAKNDWFVLEYIMHLNNTNHLKLLDKDLLYILNLAIYQKLHEISY